MNELHYGGDFQCSPRGVLDWWYQFKFQKMGTWTVYTITMCGYLFSYPSSGRVFIFLLYKPGWVDARVVHLKLGCGCCGMGGGAGQRSSVTIVYVWSICNYKMKQRMSLWNSCRERGQQLHPRFSELTLITSVTPKYVSGSIAFCLSS